MYRNCQKTRFAACSTFGYTVTSVRSLGDFAIVSIKICGFLVILLLSNEFRRDELSTST